MKRKHSSMALGFRSESLKSPIQSLKWLGLSIIAFVLVVPGSVVEAQQPGKVYRVGYLTNAAGVRKDTEESLRQALRDLGYIEAQNLVIDWRFSKGNLDLLPALAAELVRLKPDCIIASGIAPSLAAKRAAGTIPIVMANADDDPVRHGLVASLGRPGGNVTGFTNIGSDLAGKRLELLKETVPKASRVAILWDPGGPGGAGHAREAKVVAPKLGVEIQPVEVRRAEDLDNAFQAAVKGGADALIVVHTGSMNPHRARIVNLALKTKLPAMYSSSAVVLEGGLMGYSADGQERHRGVALYVDKILKGATPADLPVQQPTKFELAINLKTAKQIGVTIPDTVLYRADKVIK